MRQGSEEGKLFRKEPAKLDWYSRRKARERGNEIRRAELTLRMTGALQRSPQSGFGSSRIVRRGWPVMVSSAGAEKNLEFFGDLAGRTGVKDLLAAARQQVLDFRKYGVTSIRAGGN
jgi:hypothetical protein